MSIKYEKLEVGQTYFQKKRQKMGNTTMSRDAVFPVKILSLHPEHSTAMVSWNGNLPQCWVKRHLEKLYRNKPKVKEML